MGTAVSYHGASRGGIRAVRRVDLSDSPADEMDMAETEVARRPDVLPIHEALDTQEESIENLYGALARLYSAMESFLAAPLPDEKSEDRESPHYHSRVAGSIGENTARIDGATVMIREIRQRLGA